MNCRQFSVGSGASKGELFSRKMREESAGSKVSWSSIILIITSGTTRMLGGSRQHYQNMLLVHYIQLDSRINQISWVLVDCLGCAFFEPVTVKIWYQAEPYMPMSLEHTVLCIFQTLVNLQKDFRSVAIATYRSTLLEKLLPQEFAKKRLNLPATFYCYFDLANEFKECYGREAVSVPEMAAYVGDVSKSADIYSLAKVAVAMLVRQHIFKNLIYLDRVTGKPLLPVENSDVKYFRLRGLPFRATKQQVIEFLEIEELEEDHMNFQYNGDKFNGNAVVKVPTKFADKVNAKHEQHLLNRYIEVIPTNKEEFARGKTAFTEKSERKHSRERSRNRQRRRRRSSRDDSDSRSISYDSDNSDFSDLDSKGILKLIGLPYSCNKSEVLEFFGSHHPLENSLRFGERDGRRSGDAVILFESKRDAEEAATDLDRKKIGSRYIELIKTTPDQYRRYGPGA